MYVIIFLKNTLSLILGECRNVIVGANILNCKTKAQWNKIGAIQCSLRLYSDTLFETKACSYRQVSVDSTNASTTLLGEACLSWR